MFEQWLSVQQLTRDQVFLLDSSPTKIDMLVWWKSYAANWVSSKNVIRILVLTAGLFIPLAFSLFGYYYFQLSLYDQLRTDKSIANGHVLSLRSTRITDGEDKYFVYYVNYSYLIPHTDLTLVQEQTVNSAFYNDLLLKNERSVQIVYVPSNPNIAAIVGAEDTVVADTAPLAWGDFLLLLVVGCLLIDCYIRRMSKGQFVQGTLLSVSMRKDIDGDSWLMFHYVYVNPNSHKEITCRKRKRYDWPRDKPFPLPGAALVLWVNGQRTLLL